MYKIFRVLLLFQLLVTPAIASDKTFSGKVVKVSDGDTIQVMHEGKAEKIRLAGIDCPEKKQPFGQAAKKFTSNLIVQKIITVQVKTTDRYGRTVGEVILPDGRSLNRELVRAGYAWWYRKYSKDTSLETLESDARTTRRGLWSDPNPVAPWDWRHGGEKTTIVEKPAQASLASSNECGQKRYCKEMSSCIEAIFFFKKCGISNLDRDGDGIPCESLCK